MAKIVGTHSGGVIGDIVAYTKATAPVYTLPCNGAAVSRTTYASLFALIGITHGQGDGSTTFNVPDYRGRFLRGVDSGQGRDPDTAGRTAMATGGNSGDNVGSLQGHAFQTHTHTQNSHVHAAIPNNIRNDLQVGGSSSAYSTGTGNSGSTTATNNNTSATGTFAQASGNESRPVNAGIQYCIVWK